MYLVYYRPLGDKIANSVEVLSEIITLMLMYHLLLFTDFVPDPEVRYMIGYPFTGLMGIFITVQLIFLLYITLVNLRVRLRKRMAKRNEKISAKALQLEKKTMKSTSTHRTRNQAP